MPKQQDKITRKKWKMATGQLNDANTVRLAVACMQADPSKIKNEK